MPIHQERLLRYYAEIVASHDKEREAGSVSKDAFRYWQEHVLYRYILRMLRLENGLPVCHGAADCVEMKVVKCINGKHTTCKDHAKSCYICEAEKRNDDLAHNRRVHIGSQSVDEFRERARS
jgi:hypothetical protein